METASKSLKRDTLTHSLNSPSGQAMVEYLVMLTVAVTLVASVGSSFRNALFGIWGFYTRSISAACPTGCPPNPAYQFK